MAFRLQGCKSGYNISPYITRYRGKDLYEGLFIDGKSQFSPGPVLLRCKPRCIWCKCDGSWILIQQKVQHRRIAGKAYFYNIFLLQHMPGKEVPYLVINGPDKFIMQGFQSIFMLDAMVDP